MGLVLGVEAAAGIAEGIEAGTAAGEAIAGSAEAGEAIDAGATAGTEAGTEAGGEAAGAEGETLSTVLDKLSQAMQKIEKMVTEYLAIDAVFKAAKAILQELRNDPAAQARAKKLAKLIDVLTESVDLMKKLTTYLKVHSQDTTKIDDITVPLQGVLSEFLPRLGSVSHNIN